MEENKKSPDKVSSFGGDSRMAERLIANTLMYSPSLSSNKKTSRGPSLLHLEDFVDDGICWPAQKTLWINNCHIAQYWRLQEKNI